jgi:IS30 family transposase
MSYRHLTIDERIQLGLLKELGWSTRAIAEKLGRHHSTIARELNRNKTEVYCPKKAQHTYQNKRKTKKTFETRGRFNIGKSITNRPKIVKQRKRFGDWELDTIVSGRGKSKGCLATFVERKTRYYLAYKFQTVLLLL